LDARLSEKRLQLTSRSEGKPKLVARSGKEKKNILFFFIPEHGYEPRVRGGKNRSQAACKTEGRRGGMYQFDVPGRRRFLEAGGRGRRGEGGV